MSAAEIPAATRPSLPPLGHDWNCDSQHLEPDDLNEELGFHFIRSHGENLGSGSQGSLTADYLYSPGEIVACKTITFKPRSIKSVSAERECAALKKLGHPNIIKYLSATPPRLRSPTQMEIKIYMEYCEHGSLRDFIDMKMLAQRTATKPDFVEEDYIWNIMLQVAAALQYCHFGIEVSLKRNSKWKPILHRDIKPGNILLASTSTDAPDSIKLADFGLSVTLEGTGEFSSYIGTKSYTAPEINSNAESIKWTTACDIFSFGVTLYELCALSLPFKYRRTSAKETFEFIPYHYSQPLSSYITTCMCFNPTEHPTSSELFKMAKIATRKDNLDWRAIYRYSRPQAPQMAPKSAQLPIHPTPSVSKTRYNENSVDSLGWMGPLVTQFDKEPGPYYPWKLKGYKSGRGLELDVFEHAPPHYTDREMFRDVIDSGADSDRAREHADSDDAVSNYGITEVENPVKSNARNLFNSNSYSTSITSNMAKALVELNAEEEQEIRLNRPLEDARHARQALTGMLPLERWAQDIASDRPFAESMALKYISEAKFNTRK